LKGGNEILHEICIDGTDVDLKRTSKAEETVPLIFNLLRPSEIQAKNVKMRSIGAGLKGPQN
jgi:hypothetical protein